MRRLFKPALISTALLFTAASSALAAPKADANNDGVISRAEFMATANAQFLNADQNKDGVINPDERFKTRTTQRTNRATRLFNQADDNNDGFISESEFGARREDRIQRQHDRLDRNQSGSLDQHDLQIMRSTRDRFQDRKNRRKERLRHDANDDGIITRAEFDRATNTMFERLDVNKDGVLTKGEGQKRKKRRKRGLFR